MMEGGIVVLKYNNSNERACRNYWRITLGSVPGRIFARIVGKRIRPV